MMKCASWSYLELFDYRIANPLNLGVKSQKIRDALGRGRCCRVGTGAECLSLFEGLPRLED